MIEIRRSSDRGFFNYDWLKTYHTFSFNGYYDPNHMGFRKLRVINQDTIQPGEGFDTHSHADMEIVTLVLAGAVSHKDSTGNKTIVHKNEVQCMSAGTGIRHSESNESKTEVLELLQVWIIPDKVGLEPSYQQMSFKDVPSQFRLLISPDGQQGSLVIHQDVKMFLAALTANENLTYKMKPNRYLWIQMIKGEVVLDAEKTSLLPGDGAAVSDQDSLKITAMQPSEFVLFDLN